MKKLVLGITILLLYSCGDNSQTKSYSQQTVDSFNQLKSPVILIGKYESMNHFSIAVKDSLGKVEYYGNTSIFANTIGESRKIGDTLK